MPDSCNIVRAGSRLGGKELQVLGVLLSTDFQTPTLKGFLRPSPGDFKVSLIIFTPSVRG